MGGPVSGRVIDVQSQRPLGGAHVVVRWFGSTVGHPQSVCVHVETALTEADGYYRVPFWIQSPRFFISPARAHSDAYFEEHVHATQVNFDVHPEDVYLTRFHGPREERAKYIANSIFSGFDCNSGTTSERNLWPVLIRAYAEARVNANAEQWRELQPALREVAADAWLARPGHGPNGGSWFSRLPPDIAKDLP